MDLESDIMPVVETDSISPQGQSAEGNCQWRGYPQSLFGNWVAERVRRCKMVENCSRDSREKCKIYYVDVLKNGKFKPADDDNRPFDVDERALFQLWDKLQMKVRNNHSSLQTKLMRLCSQQVFVSGCCSLTTLSIPSFRCWERGAEIIHFSDMYLWLNINNYLGTTSNPSFSHPR